MKRNTYRWQAGAFAMVLAAASISGAQTPATAKLPPGVQGEREQGGGGKSVARSIVVNGVTRTYQLYVPRCFHPGESALIVALHGRGGGGPGALMEQYSQLDATADREGFAVVYPDGLPDATGLLNWNYFYDPFYVKGPDDVGFLRAVIDTLVPGLGVNRRRVYVTGTSAGGFMAERAGVELSDRVAAVAVVQGGLFVYSPTSPQTVPGLRSPVSVLFLKGDQDPNNYYCGATFPDFGVVEASSDQDFSYWAGKDGDDCRRVTSQTPLCASVGVVHADGSSTPGVPNAITTKTAFACKKHAEVTLYRLLGGVDMWNQGRLDVEGKTPYSPDLNGRTGVTTNEVLWNFFARHAKAGRGEGGGEER